MGNLILKTYIYSFLLIYIHLPSIIHRWWMMVGVSPVLQYVLLCTHYVDEVTEIHPYHQLFV